MYSEFKNKIYTIDAEIIMVRDVVIMADLFFCLLDFLADKWRLAIK
jgi:hypothetical protein